MTAKAEFDALQAEARDLTAQIGTAEARWAETVKAEGEDAAAAGSDDLHELRNRLQIVQARIFRLEKEMKAGRPDGDAGDRPAP